MFNAEKLLGQLLGDAFSGSFGSSKRHRPRKGSGLSGLLGGTSSLNKAKIGVGLLGLAYAAFEHYKQPGSIASSVGSSQPPVPPSSILQNGPPPPPAATIPNNENALHLIRAMICAADADGLIDVAEREGILTRAREAGLNADELQALDMEISAPLNLKQLVARTPEHLRDETYAAAFIAISADTQAELEFLEQLGNALELNQQAREEIHQQFGL